MRGLQELSGLALRCLMFQWLESEDGTLVAAEFAAHQNLTPKKYETQK